MIRIESKNDPNHMMWWINDDDPNGTRPRLASKHLKSKLQQDKIPNNKMAADEEGTKDADL